MAKLPSFFGLNLGHHSIKMSELRSDENRAKIEKIFSFPSVSGLLENDSEKGLSVLAEEIKKAHKESGIGTKNCVMSVPEVSVFSRLLSLPKVDEEDVSETIRWALKPMISVPLENVNISFLKINETKSGDKVFENWYVVAAPKSLIENMQLVAEKAGLKLLAIETEALAISRSVTFNYGVQSDVMVVDLGAENTNIILARNGIVIFSQTMNTGSEAITKVIASDYGIDIAQAEKYKQTYGMNYSEGEGKIAKSIEPLIEIISGEISRTITYFNERIGGGKIENLYLTGGGSKLPHLDLYLKEKIGISTTVFSLNSQKFSLDGSVKAFVEQNNINSFVASIGLGLKKAEE